MKSIRVATIGALALIAVAAGIRFVWPPAPPETHELLREVYTPHFAAVPQPVGISGLAATLREGWHSPQGTAFARRWLPSQGGTLWFSLLAMVAVGVNARRLWHPRHLDLVAVQILGVCFFDILLFTRRFQDPYSLAFLWRIFDAVVAISLFLALRAAWRVVRPLGEDWRASSGRKALAAVALVAVTLDVTVALVRQPDDSGYFVNLGAQRLRERGRLPYGDPLLTGTPGAAYGPLLYAAHVPFQLLVDPVHLNESSSPRPPLGSDSQYRVPSARATQLCAATFLVFGAWMLFVAGRRYGSPETGWTLVALYCSSAFVIGMGGEEYYVGGMTYISHIAPPAVTTAAFAALAQPALSGVLLVIATGCGFYPAFLVPAFLGYYSARRLDLARFVMALVIAGAVLAVFVLLLSRPAAGRGLIGTILWDTFGHHSDPAGYGASPFGFWGQRTGWRAWLIRPLFGGTGLLAPVMLMFFGFAAACFPLARKRGARELALLSAAVVIGANLVKIHATGTYVAWFYPFLLLGWFLPERPAADASSATIADSPCPKGPDNQSS